MEIFSDDRGCILKFSEKTFSFSLFHYLTGWVHKTNTVQTARTHPTRMWRKKGEGLKRECSAKGKKEGTAGRMAKFFVAIAYGRVP